ncbi:MAG: hypothetical protein K0U68_14490 [Gammaproteobacteria bacterium]|nr:hypothetical protein [Gammaproteobacteria bacterium]
MKNLIAIGLLLCGIAVLVFGLPDKKSSLQVTEEQDLASESSDFPQLHGFFTADTLRTLTVSGENKSALKFHQVIYHDATSEYSALIFLEPKQQGISTLPTSSHADAWLELKQTGQSLSSANSILLGWWDNSQRARFYSNAQVWLQSPLAEMFPSETQTVWKQLSGGFGSDTKPSQQLAEWLLMDADDALQSIKTHFQEKTVKLVVSLDDLSRLSEMAALTNRPIPFETRIFSQADNLHTMITQVKRWSRNQASGSYLLQKISPMQIRAWRITSQAGENTLLAKLLPFTSTLTNPNEQLSLLMRSKSDNYLSLFQVL